MPGGDPNGPPQNRGINLIDEAIDAVNAALDSVTIPEKARPDLHNALASLLRAANK